MLKDSDSVNNNCNADKVVLETLIHARYMIKTIKCTIWKHIKKGSGYDPFENSNLGPDPGQKNADPNPIKK